jgi:glycosyltransferase involved in cell wall biosynthesis
MGPRGGVVTQRSAKPCTPVQFWSWPPPQAFDFTEISIRAWFRCADTAILAACSCIHEPWSKNRMHPARPTAGASPETAVISGAQLPLDDPQRPAVSIVMATYNRPAVLAFAIRSVVAQEFHDWELIVVGDGCSEETATVVASFADQRIRYINLALNCGDQSGPNNVGISRARGCYVAFLNQDDFWFFDHLRAARDWLEATGADGVIARSAFITWPDGALQWDAAGWQSCLNGAGIDGRYDPVVTNGPASSLLLRAEAIRAAGPWRSAQDCFSSSSQEWLFRIWKAGFKLRTMPHLTVVQLPSASRPQSYVRSETSEHQFFEEKLKQPLHFRLSLLDRSKLPPSRRPRTRSIVFFLLRAAAYLGWSPTELIGRFWLVRRRGAFINKLRELRGLQSMPEREPSIASLRDRYAAEQAGKPASSAEPLVK